MDVAICQLDQIDQALTDCHLHVSTDEDGAMGHQHLKNTSKVKMQELPDDGRRRHFGHRDDTRTE